MNLAYSKELNKWMKKAFELGLAGAIVVCLVPVRTDTSQWFLNYCSQGEIRFIKDRLKFGNSDNSQRQPRRKKAVGARFCTNLYLGITSCPYQTEASFEEKRCSVIPLE